MTSIPNVAGPAAAGSTAPVLPSPATPPAPSGYAPVEALLAAQGRRSGASDRLRRRQALLPSLSRDPLLLLAVALVVPVVAMEVFIGSTRPGIAVAASALFIAIQVGLGRVRGWPRAIRLTRFALCMAFVAYANLDLISGAGWPLLSLVVPIVALAAASGGEALWIVGAALALTLAPVVTMSLADDVRRQLVAITMASGVMALGSRRIVASLERSRDRLRRAQARERRRVRQLAAVERVGAILAREGPSPAALDSVVGLLAETFGYDYPSIYVWNGGVLRLGAQRNYTAPIEEFPADLGIIGRVARTREAVFLSDVSADPDYVAADNDVTGEISVPLLGDGDLLGVLNVETGGSRHLDADDFSTLTIVADRLAVSLALGRERQKLTERARLMDRLVAFSRSLGRSLDPATVHEQVAAGASRVITADMAVLALLDPATGEYRTVKVEGGDPAALGVRILPGEGITGRAIESTTVVADDRLERRAFPKGAARIRMADTVAAMSAPLIGDHGAVGAVSWFREDLARPFTAQEREVAALVAAQVALAIANAELHHATEVAAVTDALTGLHNRRFFDTSMVRAEASRRRAAEDERRPVSAIMFDLDHFGLVNKRHGHQTGDRILQAFAEVVRRRVRASDLVARYGGEEFVVVLDGATRTEAVRLADEIRETFAGVRFALPDGAAIGCTVSAGCSALAESETAGALLIERADVGLAMAKASGRDRVVAA
ncbi:MAG: sensor domain-containing diguanylate cyclase [Chloroflexi bacterium]|nr:sensor domain-containing diguanylate cyclase [Chloroflexota bacterium]